MKYFITIAVYLFSSVIIFADGLSFDGDRLDGYNTSVIQLTEKQKSLLADIDEKRSIKLKLTSAQQHFLKETSSYSTNEIEVYALEMAQWTCTCEEINFGVMVHPDYVEIPHEFLGDTLFDRFKLTRNKTTKEVFYQAGKPPQNPPYYTIAIIFTLLLAAYMLIRRKRARTK